MKMRRLALALLALPALAAAGCSGRAPLPGVGATETVIAARIYATLTASAPSPTLGPTVTLAPTRTPAPETPAPASPAPMAVVAAGPTPLPAAAAATVAASPPPATPPPTATPTPTAAAADTPAPQRATVTSATANLRAGPGTGHAVIATVTQGQAFGVTGRNADGSWLEIALPGGGVAWVSATVVALNVPAGSVALARGIPTAPPAPTAAPTAVRPLEVTFINPHYDCEQGELQYTGADGKRYPIWGYRYFQIDMYIKNNGQEPVEPPWKPRRWIITDGKTDVVNDLMWQWANTRTGMYQQPTIKPGESAGWTFLAFPIDRNQWLKAVEFEWKGQLYRQGFDLGPLRNADNYRDCGDPKNHTARPTPTPRP